MPLSPADAYLLGSMPRRIFHTRVQSRVDGDDAFKQVQDFAVQWVALLDALKEKSLRPAVQALKDRLELEQDYADAQKRYNRLATLHSLAQNAPSPGNPPAAIPIAPDSRDLALALLDRPEHALIREMLPPDLRELHEMGYLVAECRWGNTDENSCLRIWDIAKRLGFEECVTGRMPGSPLGQNESIERAVQRRASNIDERFLTQPINLPEPAPAELPSGPYLTIAEVAQLLKVGEDTVERLINTGQLSASEVSGKGKSAGRKVKRIRREAIDEYMKRTEIREPEKTGDRKHIELKPRRDHFA